MPLTKVRGSGIGDSTTALDVKSLGVDFTSDSYQIVKIQTDNNDDGSNDDAILQFTNGSSKTVKGEIRYDESESMFEIGQGDNQGHIKIDSSGRVGIDVSPTAQFGHSILQIGGQATLGANKTLSATGQTYLSHNLYFNTDGNYRVFNTSNANEGTILQMVDGNFIFSNSSATTGTPTVTERARINGSGQASFRNGIAFRPLADYTLTTSYQDICEIDTNNGNVGRGFILAVSSENNYQQHWNIQVSQNDISTHFFGGDSGHTHSKDVQWRKNNSHIQAKRSLSTGRSLSLYCAVGACVLDFDS